LLNWPSFIRFIRFLSFFTIVIMFRFLIWLFSDIVDSIWHWISFFHGIKCRAVEAKLLRCVDISLLRSMRSRFHFFCFSVETIMWETKCIKRRRRIWNRCFFIFPSFFRSRYYSKIFKCFWAKSTVYLALTLTTHRHVFNLNSRCFIVVDALIVVFILESSIVIL